MSVSYKRYKNKNSPASALPRRTYVTNNLEKPVSAPTVEALQAEVLRLQRELAEREHRQPALPLPDVHAPARREPPKRTARYVRLTAVELNTLELVYTELLHRGRFARVLPAEYDPLPTAESEVDAFIAARTREWREKLAKGLERVFMRHDQRVRALTVLEGKPLEEVDWTKDGEP